MATIDTTAATTRSRKGFTRNAVKHSLRIDMTPMADLVLLLITFFTFTTTMMEPKTTNLYMPASGPESNTPESGALTILIGKDGSLHYYEGKLKNDGSNIIQTNNTDLRNKIIQKKTEVVAAYTRDAACEADAVANKRSIEDCKQQKMMVLIKPNNDADYKSLVGVLDEMTINRIARYAIVDPGKEELQFFK